MNITKKYFVFSICLCGLLFNYSTVMAQNLRGNSLYSDHKARQIGDVLTILIVEQSKASSEATTATKKETGIDIDSKMGGQDFKPLFGLDAGLDNKFSGAGKTQRQGTLKARISAAVMKVRDNGDLEVQGSRELDVNGEKEVITVSGVVRPADISAQNSVFSYNVADAKISYKGKGTVNNGHRPGLLARFFNWLF